MTTALTPVDPAAVPQRTNRLLGIAANLLPEEITLARRARRTRGWVIIVVVLVAAMMAGWFFLANQDTRAADAELTNATGDVTALQRDQRDYAPVVQVKNDTDALNKQLKAIMGNDLDWAAMVTLLRETGENTNTGVDVQGINGSLLAPVSGEEAAAPDASGTAVIGTLEITGEAPDKKAVAAYIDALGRQKLVADPYLTAVRQGEDGSVSFNLNVDITSAALCGRFGEKCATRETE